MGHGLPAYSILNREVDSVDDHCDYRGSVFILYLSRKGAVSLPALSVDLSKAMEIDVTVYITP